MSLTVWISVAVVIIATVGIIKLSSEKQKVAIKMLLFLFAFVAISVSYIGIKNGVDLTDYDSVVNTTKIYFSWLGNVANNLGKATGYVIHQDWGFNSTNMTK